LKNELKQKKEKKMYPFLIDKEYSKKDIYKIIGIPIDTHGGNWDTGYNQYKDDFFLFVNIGVPGRTGNDYNNYFEGNLLYYEAKNNTNINHPQIQRMLNPKGYIYIFYRYDNVRPFTFAGTAIPFSHKDTTPVQIIWEIINDFNDLIGTKNEIDNVNNLLTEGSKIERLINVYERNPVARKHCIETYGCICRVCGFNFESKYGEIGKNFIHVHHIKPLAEIKENYIIDPIKDLVPVCPNCHAMLHRKMPALTIDELKEIIK
jgi:5-methylcytosine-specific restriction protein A